MPFFVYLLECGGKSYYCGWTKNLDARVKAHNSGRGGAYTRAHLPVKLVYYERKKSIGAALRREARIKSLSRSEKKRLVEKAARLKSSRGARPPLSVKKKNRAFNARFFPVVRN
jgi:putative endonuclease